MDGVGRSLSLQSQCCDAGGVFAGGGGSNPRVQQGREDAMQKILVGRSDPDELPFKMSFLPLAFGVGGGGDMVQPIPHPKPQESKKSKMPPHPPAFFLLFCCKKFARSMPKFARISKIWQFVGFFFCFSPISAGKTSQKKSPKSEEEVPEVQVQDRIFRDFFQGHLHPSKRALTQCMCGGRGDDGVASSPLPFVLRGVF